MIIDKSVRGNYRYVCKKCKIYQILAEIVPHWSEYFDEHGYGIDSDYDENGNKKY